MTIHFSNTEPLELDFIRIMGASVKDGEDAIGYFGTGLKYAIAILLREGCEVSLMLNNIRYVFTARDTSLRGKSFRQVYMNEEKLGFTTDLGRNWHLWMAYRELYSNCKDEGGVISTTPVYESATVFSVTSDAFALIHENRHDIFLNTMPIVEAGSVEFHNHTTSNLFYKGVKVRDNEMTSLYTYNLKSGQSLTEDRTLASYGMYKYRISDAIANLSNLSILRTILTEEKSWEAEIFVPLSSQASPQFIQICEEERQKGNLAKPYYAFLLKLKPEPKSYPPKVPTGYEHHMLLEACRLCTAMGIPVELEDFVYTDQLPENLYGMFEPQSDKVYISLKALEQGNLHLAATIYEEFMHKNLSIEDYSREFQDHLLQKLAHVHADRLYS